MATSAEQMFLTCKRIYPETEGEIATLAAAIYNHVTGKMKLPYNEDCISFINDSLAQREITTEPFGKKFNELTGLATHGIESLPRKNIDTVDDFIIATTIRAVLSHVEQEAINDRTEAIDNARRSSLGMGIKERDDFLKFMMEEPLDGEASETVIEKMTSVINKAVTLSLQDKDYLQGQRNRYDSSIHDLSAAFMSLANMPYHGLPKDVKMHAAQILDETVSDISGEVVRNIFGWLDILEQNRKGALSSAPGGPEAPHT